MIFDPAVLKNLVNSAGPNVAVVDSYTSNMDGTIIMGLEWLGNIPARNQLQAP